MKRKLEATLTNDNSERGDARSKRQKERMGSSNTPENVATNRRRVLSGWTNILTDALFGLPADVPDEGENPNNNQLSTKLTLAGHVVKAMATSSTGTLISPYATHIFEWYLNIFLD